ncbi:MAG: glycosyltransferase 61 family protein [Microcella sp.]|nr:glycosyltransferase 61 family protein [Microcella sp.]
MAVRLDRLWARDELPEWCRVVAESTESVRFGDAATDALHDGDEWVDVRRAVDQHSMLPEIVIELDDVTVSSTGGMWRGGEPVLGKAWGLVSVADDSDAELRSTPPIVELSGTHGSVVQHARAFGHWLLQRLPRLHSLNRTAAPPRMISVELPYDDQPVFDSCGILAGDVHRLKRVPAARATLERVALTTDLAPPSGDRSIDAGRLAALVDDLDQRWRSALEQSTSSADVYITRRAVRHERDGCSNGDQLERFFADRGYTVVYPPDLTLPEQFALFRGARSVVGEMGSGMHWAIVCAPETSITYLTPRSGTRGHPFDLDRKSWMRAIADARGLHFGQIIANPDALRNAWAADLRRVSAAWSSRPDSIAPHSPR